ncbi:MAG: glycosyl transferase, partial [Bacteroidota bacterium]
VFTKAKPTVGEFLSQRIRWASKSTSYKEWQVTFILGMVFLFCCNMVFSLAAIFWWGWLAAWVFAGSFLVKTILDFFFLGNMARFFSRMDLMRSYFPSQFLHIAYIVVVGILGNLVKRYEWKGRRVR